MKATGLLSILIMLSNIVYLKAQDLPHDISLHPEDDLYLILYFQYPTCPGFCDGSVIAAASGGQPPYSYSWSNGMTGVEIHDLCAGYGDVTVTDALGDTLTEEYILYDPPGPTYFETNLTIVQPTGGQSNGSISIDSTGFLDSPFYHVDSLFSIDGVNFIPYYIFPHLSPGTYFLYLKVTLESGCVVVVRSLNEIILFDITAVEELTASFNLYPNPVINMLQLSADILLKVELFDVQGRKLFVSDFNTFHQISMAGYPEGIYLARISDGRGASYKKILKVSE